MASVKYTYAARKRCIADTLPSSSSPPTSPSILRPCKRLFSSAFKNENALPSSKRLKSTKPKVTSKPQHTRVQKTLTQLHFNIDQTIFRTCSSCDLSYTKGALDDERLHKAHCSRVRQGMEWGRDEERDRVKHAGNVVVEVKSNVKLRKSKKIGRVICFPADIGGKIGSKLATFLETINLSLSAPNLPQSALHSSKAYLFLLPSDTQSHREHIVGCIIAQRINTAMEIISSPTAPDSQGTTSESTIIVDTTTNLCCSPTPLQTPMGISRLFVSASHRRQGIADSLLDIAAATFIHGCQLDPRKGQVAFSQPTGMGQAVMAHWGCTRVYEE